MSGIDEDSAMCVTIREDIVGFWSAVEAGPLVALRTGRGEAGVDVAAGVEAVAEVVEVLARVEEITDDGSGGEGDDEDLEIGSDEDIVSTGLVREDDEVELSGWSVGKMHVVSS